VPPGDPFRVTVKCREEIDRVPEIFLGTPPSRLKGR